MHAWINCRERGQGLENVLLAWTYAVVRARGHPIQQQVPTEALQTQCLFLASATQAGHYTL